MKVKVAIYSHVCCCCTGGEIEYDTETILESFEDLIKFIKKHQLDDEDDSSDRIQIRGLELSEEEEALLQN